MSSEDAGASGEGTGAPAEPEERSAGGVVVRGEEALVIVPTRRAADGSEVLGLPKGHIDEGETAAQAAEREVREETGVTAELRGELGVVRYRYRRGGRTVSKSVRFFLFDYVSGDTADHDHEVREAFWVDLRRAREELTYEGEREVVGRALALLQKSR